MSIVINKMIPEEVESLYPALFADVFGQWQEGHVPGFVLAIFDDGKYVGFLACYDHDAHTVYIQYCGIKPEARGARTLTIWRKTVETLHERYAFILGRIRNDNTAALKAALMAGLIVNGVRQATDGKLYVEVIRGRSGC